MGNIGAHYYDWRYKNAGQVAYPNPDIKPVTVAAGALGSPGNCIKMSFTPSTTASQIAANGQPLADMVGKITGYCFKVDILTSYAAVLTSMGANNTDVAWLAPLQYAVGNQKFGASVILATVRNG